LPDLHTRGVSDPVFDVPREVELTEPAGRPSLSLLRLNDFRTLFVAVSISELGDALNYIALMWLALEHGGALGVVAVRLADSLPAWCASRRSSRSRHSASRAR